MEAIKRCQYSGEHIVCHRATTIKNEWLHEMETEYIYIVLYSMQRGKHEREKNKKQKKEFDGRESFIRNHYNQFRWWQNERENLVCFRF